MRTADKWEFKIDPDNNMLIGPNGCHYEEHEKPNAMYFDQLGLCGCGRPECIHKLIVDCAMMFDRDKNRWDGEAGVKGIEKIVKERPDYVAEFIAHFLDQKDLIEHGGSVYGSWLTERGKQFIEIGPMIDA